MAYRGHREIKDLHGRDVFVIHFVDDSTDLAALVNGRAGDLAQCIAAGADDGKTFIYQKASGGTVWAEFLTGAGNMTITGDLAVTGDVAVGDDLTVTDDVTIGGDVTLSGGSLGVTGAIVATGNLVAGGDAAIDGAVTVGGGSMTLGAGALSPTSLTRTSTVARVQLLPDADGTLVIGPQAAEANLTPSDAGDFATLQAATDAGSVTELVAALNLIENKLNAVLTKLEASGLLAP